MPALLEDISHWEFSDLPNLSCTYLLHSVLYSIGCLDVGLFLPLLQFTLGVFLFILVTTAWSSLSLALEASNQYWLNKWS